MTENTEEPKKDVTTQPTKETAQGTKCKKCKIPGWLKKKWVKWVLGIVITLIILIVALLLSLSIIVKHSAQVIATKLTKCETTIDHMYISVLGGHVSIRGVTVKNPTRKYDNSPCSFSADTLFTLQKITVDFRLLSLLTDTIIVDDILVESPVVTIEKPIVGDSNLTVVMDNINGGKSSDGKTATSDDGKTPELETVDDEQLEPDSAKEGETGIIIKHMKISGVKVNGRFAKIPLNLSMTDMELNDVGGKEGSHGVSAKELVKTIFGTLVKSILSTVNDAGASLLDGAKETGTMLKQGAKNVTDGMKNMFKRN